MGKPFDDEIKLSNQILNWVTTLDLDHLAKAFELPNESNVYIVGSGGSLSACYYLEFLLERKGIFAKSVTPLEIIGSKNSIQNSVIFLISAGGRNKDILFAFKKIVQERPKFVHSICMQLESPLKELSQKTSNCQIYEFEIPTGKDGFLATNSLAAYFGIFTVIFGDKKELTKLRVYSKTFFDEINNFVNSIDSRHTLFVLYSNSTKSVAMDIESKCIEAALCDLSTADYRNFGHGQHNWIDKRPNETAMIFLTTNHDSELALKTSDAIPNSIPKLFLNSKSSTPYSCVDLLIKSYHLISALGKNAKIDPGRPGIPPFGRKLYNLSYISVFNEKLPISKNAYFSIKHKIGALNIADKSKCKQWHIYYTNYLREINKAKYCGIIFDFDGTLCASDKRFLGVDDKLKDSLLSILNSGFIIGVSTGRGKSARESLTSFIPKKHHKNVIISYYNGYETGNLLNDNLPNTKGVNDPNITKAFKILDSKLSGLDVKIEKRPGQISLEIREKNYPKKIKAFIRNILLSNFEINVQILESDHSMDIIPWNISKLSISNFCINRAKELDLQGRLLTIGDKGEWPGNDFLLLSTKNSLSVDEVTLDPDSCWNLSPLGLSNVEATQFYLENLLFKERFMHLNLKK